MSFTMKDAYSVMLREYPDVMNIEQMSQALGVSTKTGYGLLKSGKHRLTRAHREKQLKMSCQALHNAPPNRT